MKHEEMAENCAEAQDKLDKVYKVFYEVLQQGIASNIITVTVTAGLF